MEVEVGERGEDWGMRVRAFGATGFEREDGALRREEDSVFGAYAEGSGRGSVDEGGVELGGGRRRGGRVVE